MAERKFVNAMLKAHNDYRKNHGAQPLRINRDLNNMAQRWAEELARTNSFQHSRDRKLQGQPVGENLSMKWTSNNEEYTGEEATKQWYDEISKYNFRTASGPGTGHFTQVVWKGSEELGVGKAQTRDGKWIAVANYFPAGNYIGCYHENVLPPGAAPSKQKPQKSSAPPPTVGPATPAARENRPRGWFGLKPSSRSTSKETTKEVPVTQIREFTPVFGASGGSRPTFTTTIVTERNNSSSNQPSFVRPPPGVTTSGYSRTVVTETVIGPDGSKQVTTREVVKTHDGQPMQSTVNTVQRRY